MKLLLTANQLTTLRNTAGFMLSESLCALAISMVSLCSVMVANSHSLKLVKSTRDSSAATLCLQERVEQLRIANWQQITRAEYLQNSYFATVPRSIAPLEGSYTETITVSAYPDRTAASPLVVQKSNRKAAVVVFNGAGLAEQRLARIDVDISWKGKEGRQRLRQMSTIINNGGISRMNLPAMGPAGGGAQSSTTTSTTAPSTTTTTGTQSTPAATSTAIVSTRGNVAGKKGKG